MGSYSYDPYFYWTTEQGEEIRIKDLTNKHLDNIIAMLKKKNALNKYPQLISERRARLIKSSELGKILYG